MITITEFKNHKYISENCIEAEIKHPDHGWIPMSVEQGYSADHLDFPDLFEKLKVGATAFTPKTDAEKTAELAIEKRIERDARLSRDVDPLASNPLRWDDLSVEVQNKIKAYRTALLNVPQQSGFPSSISWPSKDF